LFPFVTKALYIALSGAITIISFVRPINVFKSKVGSMVSSFLEVIALLIVNYFLGGTMVSLFFLSKEVLSLVVSVKLFLISNFISLGFLIAISALGG